MQLVDVSGYGTDHALYAALWVKTANAPAWAARHGLTAAQYQHEFDTLTARGFHPVLVDGYGIGGQARFAAIFRQGDTPAWIARHGLTAAQYQEAFTDNATKGFVLKWVSGYADGSEARYAAIWRKTPGAPARVARHGLTSAQYQQAFDDLTRQGYKPVVVSGYPIAGQDHYAAIFRRIPNAPAWAARHGLTAAQYQHEFDTLMARGFHPVLGYGIGGQARFAAIFRQGDTPAWIARHGFTAQQYQAAFDQMGRQGYRLELVSAYSISGGDRFAAVWTK